MDQYLGLNATDRRRAADRLTAFVAQSIDAARVDQTPFYHLQFDRVFPEQSTSGARLELLKRLTGRRSDNPESPAD